MWYVQKNNEMTRAGVVAAVAPAPTAATAASAPAPTPALLLVLPPLVPVPLLAYSWLYSSLSLSLLVPASPRSFVLIVATWSHPLGLRLLSCHLRSFGLIPAA